MPSFHVVIFQTFFSTEFGNPTEIGMFFFSVTKKSAGKNIHPQTEKQKGLDSNPVGLPECGTEIR